MLARTGVAFQGRRFESHRGASTTLFTANYYAAARHGIKRVSTLCTVHAMVPASGQPAHLHRTLSGPNSPSHMPTQAVANPPKLVGLGWRAAGWGEVRTRCTTCSNTRCTFAFSAATMIPALVSGHETRLSPPYSQTIARCSQCCTVCGTFHTANPTFPCVQSAGEGTTERDKRKIKTKLRIPPSISSQKTIQFLRWTLFLTCFSNTQMGEATPNPKTARSPCHCHAATPPHPVPPVCQGSTTPRVTGPVARFAGVPPPKPCLGRA